MNRILVCTNFEKDTSLSFTLQVLSFLREHGAEAAAFLPLIPEERLPADLPEGILCPDPEAYLRSADLLLCLGGDGTMLHNSKLAARCGVPMLGINLGHMGFITELERDDMGRLAEVLQGRYTVENRMMLDFEVKRDGETVCSGFGLNEAVVARRSPAHSIHLTAYGDDRKISDYSGDGIIIATPTGSTAYSMAAGGPIVEPTAENLLLTPMCAHSLTAKPYVLAGDRHTSVKLVRGDDGEAMLLVDGEDSCTLKTGDLVYVRKSRYVTRLIKLRKLSFYDIVRHKLN
ncbi:MAG: NAD(+)/NADH kinase [Oscillospiraceae bacterium]|nr:NAD(+)/NADH kinase [Oscillospiraceae bacterium]